MTEQRLQKILAQAGVASRRSAEAIIKAGRVAVDGKTVTELGFKADPQKQTITLDNKPLPKPEAFEYWLLHKPVDIVTTVKDTHGRKTVMDLLPPEVKARVYPVGRLDQDSEGLVLMTNDGDLAYRLTQAKYKVPKLYKVWVDGYVNSQMLNTLRTGVPLEEGVTMPARVHVKSASSKNSKLSVVLHEGHKRQIRRMCSYVGLKVKRLVRLSVGPVKLGDLPPGEARKLTAQEVKQLKLQSQEIHACTKVKHSVNNCSSRREKTEGRNKRPTPRGKKK
ncbi:pseudouridine synthase [Dethiosulfatarculus sandiegensis]|uniref:pseudouridine synthase n=1 Tax=Dethiosulfatarculus sandiegensis TaxID=1429043 RepID=UPI0009E6C80C|nr:pseudouridine synthase [Dethiosulfatarculus sandiegensis]